MKDKPKFEPKKLAFTIAAIAIVIIVCVAIFMMSDKEEAASGQSETNIEGENSASEKNAKGEIVTYLSEDGNWKIDYDTSKFALNDTLGNGEIGFNYIGECSGTHSVVISYHKDKMPDEVLYEKVKDIDDSRIERGESSFGMDMYWSHFRHIKPENEDPNEGDVVYEGYTAIEHNGGTILLDFIGHLETNDEWYSNEMNDESRLLNTFELLNHQPQTEYSYIPGIYTREYTDEIDGDTVSIKESVILREDHSCEITFQDTEYGEWTGTKIVMNFGDDYEYSVEGDFLYLNINDNWVEFKKE